MPVDPKKAGIPTTTWRPKQDIAAVRAELALVEHRLLTRLGGLIVVGLTLLFAALHYWPPGRG